MATTTGGTTYVTSTDLVADYPTASLALANRVDVVASGSMSKKTASYTVTVADILAGTTICMNSASATVITLPSTSLVNGMMLNVFSVNTGAVTFTGGTVTGAVNSITAQYTGVSLTYDSAAAVWWCLPFGGGASRPSSISYLVIGGGGAGGANSDGSETGGGGSGQYLTGTTAPTGGTTYTITVGAGAAGSIFANAFNGVGTPSSGFSQTAAGGGRGRSVVNGPVWQEATVNGGGNSRGGGGASNYPSASSNANGSAGTSSSITLSAVTRAGGGGGYNGGTGGAGGGGAYGNNAGTVNTGSGGGSGVNYGGAGGSGCIIVSQLANAALPTVLTGTPYTYSDGTNIVFFFYGSGSIGWA